MSDEVANHLRAAIMSGALEPGSFVRLQQTAADLEVSITPVREALLTLCAEGLVRRERHRGYAVLPRSAQDLRDICWLQDRIADELAATMGGRLTRNQLDELERFNDALTSAVASKSSEAIAATESAFQETLSRASGRVVLTQFLLSAMRYIHPQVDADPHWVRLATEINRRIIAALRRHGASPAMPLRTEALETGRQAETSPSRLGAVATARVSSKAIGVGQLRSDTLGYIARATAGEIIHVVRRGTIVAQIVAPDDRSCGGSARSCTATRVALDELRTRAGHLLDRVAAAENLEIIHDHEVVALIVRPCSR